MPQEKPDRPKRLTAQMKFKIYLETRAKDAPIGEILRRYGLHLKDLRDIEEKVEGAAIAGLKVHYGRKKNRHDVTPEEYEELAEELRQKDKALADLAAEYQLFKKKEALELRRKKKGKSFSKD
jgi:hypothetical protein